jgi:hypothetical protein
MLAFMPADHYHRDLRDYLEAIIYRCRWSPDPRGELSRLASQLRVGFKREDIGRAVREAVRRHSLAILLSLVCNPLKAEVFNTVEFPGGVESFADRVLDFDPYFSGGTAVVTSRPYLTLGAPEDFYFQSLGDGGLIELLLLDNLLTNSRGSSPDLYVGEVGGTAEDFFVALRPTPETRALLSPLGDVNEDGFFEIGRHIGVQRSFAEGFVRLIDIDQYFPQQNHLLLTFDAIQILDDPERGEATGFNAGFDLESVGAISSISTGLVLLPGDTNFDHVVDLSDLNNVRNNFGGNWLGDTLPFDGVVDLGDMNAVRNNFGSMGSTIIPEPASFALFALIAGLLAVIRAALPRPEYSQRKTPPQESQGGA